MAKKEKTLISREGWHTSKIERRAYIIGEIGRCCEGGIVTSFMTLFLIFQGIDLKLAAEVGEEWDDEEIYFVIDEMRQSFPNLIYQPVSYCAGILTLSR